MCILFRRVFYATTAHQSDQAAMADILGLPSGWDQTCPIPVGFTIDGFSPAPRKPVVDVVVWNALVS